MRTFFGFARVYSVWQVVTYCACAILGLVQLVHCGILWLVAVSASVCGLWCMWHEVPGMDGVWGVGHCTWCGFGWVWDLYWPCHFGLGVGWDGVWTVGYEACGMYIVWCRVWKHVGVIRCICGGCVAVPLRSGGGHVAGARWCGCAMVWRCNGVVVMVCQKCRVRNCILRAQKNNMVEQLPKIWGMGHPSWYRVWMAHGICWCGRCGVVLCGCGLLSGMGHGPLGFGVGC